MQWGALSPPPEQDEEFILGETRPISTMDLERYLITPQPILEPALPVGWVL